MPSEKDSSNPAGNVSDHSGPQRPLPSATAEQSEARIRGGNVSQSKPFETSEMRREFRWFEFASISLNGALAIVGIIALCIYHGQLTVMSGQLAEMQAARKQAKVDNAAAIAAQEKIATDALIASQKNFEKSAQNAEAALRNEERAWIGISNHIVTKFDQNGIIAAVTVTNSGKTPARNVRVHVRTAAVNMTMDGPSEDEVKNLSMPPWEQKPDIPPQGSVALLVGELPPGQTSTRENQALAEGLKLRFKAIKDSDTQRLLFWSRSLRECQSPTARDQVLLIYRRHHH
jgi:hypothetical protein